MKDFNYRTGNIELGITFDARLKKPRIKEQLLFTPEFYKKTYTETHSAPNCQPVWKEFVTVC